MKPKEDYVGQIFNRLTILRRAASRNNSAYYLCSCSCSNSTIKEVRLSHLKSGKIKSCGCLGSEATSKRNTKHGLRRIHPIEYGVWFELRKKCRDPNHPAYRYYGGAGVTISNAWYSQFDSFLRSVGIRKSKAYTLERIDHTKGFEEGNCRWVERKESTYVGLTRTKYLYLGKTYTLKQLAAIHNIKYKTAWVRLNQLHWPLDKVLTTREWENPPEYTSKEELQLRNFVSSIIYGDTKILTNIKTIIPPYELDICLPDTGVAIECNGLHWHTQFGGKSKDYHRKKSLRCQKVGLTLIHIIDQEWLVNRLIVEDILKTRLNPHSLTVLDLKGSYIEEVSENDYYRFYKENSLELRAFSERYCALFTDKLIYSVFSYDLSSSGNVVVTSLAKSLGVSWEGIINKIMEYLVSRKYEGTVYATVNTSRGLHKEFENSGFTVVSFGQPVGYAVSGRRMEPLPKVWDGEIYWDAGEVTLAREN